MDALATSCVTVAVPQRGRAGMERTEMGEWSIMAGQLRRRLSVAAVRAPCLSLHGRLKLIGPGLTEAADRRAAGLAMVHTIEQDRINFLQTLCTPQHRVRQGFGKT